MMATLGPALTAQSGNGALYLALAAIAVSSVVCGASLYLLGLNRLGRLGRFIPFPVLAGFRGASGGLMALGAIRISTGIPIKLMTVPQFANPEIAAMAAITIGWSIALSRLTARFKHFATLPVAIISAVIITDLAFGLLQKWGLPLNIEHWMFNVKDEAFVILPALHSNFWHVDWMAILTAWPEIAAIAIMAALSVLLASTGLEQSARVDIDLDRELRVHGLANIASGLLGGFSGNISINRTTMAQEAGGTGRVAGVVAAAITLALLAGGIGIVGFIPRFVLAGLLLDIGTQSMWRQVVLSRGKLSLLEWLLIPIMVVTIALFGVLIGLLIGIVSGCIIFAVSVSRVDIVKRQLTIAERSSSLVRSSEEMAVIANNSDHVQILQLASFMFFGSAYRLQERVVAMIHTKRPVVVIFDFTAVDGIDSSAGSSLRRIHELLSDSKTLQIVVCPSAEIRHIMSDSGALNKAVLLYESLDEALEHAENTLLDHVTLNIAVQRPLSIWLTEALGSAERARHLIKELEPAQIAEDGFLCRTGDPTDTLFLVEHGRVSVEVERPGLPPIRHRMFGSNTILGEVGFFLCVPRTASLRVDANASVWALSRAAYDRLSQHHPSLTAALLIYTVRIQGERLAFTSTQVAALQR